MISKNVENMIPKIQQFFGSQPIKKAWLFGSCSRGEESMDSDVDILVEYDRQNSRVSLMKIAAMMLNLEDLLHRKVGKHPTPILAVWTISATFAPC